MTTAVRHPPPSAPPTTGPDGLIRWLLRVQWRSIAAGSTAGIIWMGGFAAAPILVGEAIDDAIEQAGAARMAVWIAALVGVVAASAFAGAIRHRFAISLWVGTGLLGEGHLSRRVLDRRGGIDRAPGELVSLGVGDANKIGNIADITNRGSGAVVALVGTAVWLLSTSVSLGLLVLVAVPATAAVIVPFLSAYDARATAERRELAEATAAAADGITGLRTANGLGGGAQVLAWFGERSARMHAAALALVRFEARLFAAVGILPWFTLVPVLWFGGNQAIDGTITPGTLITVVGLAQFLTTPIGTLAEAAQYVTAGRASARRITDVTRTGAAVEEVDGSSVPPVDADREVAAALELRDLELDDLGPVALTVAVGETVGVACHRDGDAAALVALLARRRDPAGGAVLVSGRPIDTQALDDLPATLAVVDTERPWLLSGTLLDNLRLARPDATRDQAIEALRSAGADDVIRHPASLDRPIGERGLRLSGGQRQRVAVAQALLMVTEVLVVVEPTSALDAVTEATVVERFAAADRPATLVLSTSPTVLAACDRVVFVEGGRVESIAGHRQLVAANDRYRRLVGSAS
ncbi:MAG: ABC transporter ATP-binding protein [Actinomycetota bacterium]